MSTNGIIFSADFDRFEKFFSTRHAQTVIEKHSRRAIIKASLYAIKALRKNIRNKKFLPNAPLTLALTRGTIPLLKAGNLDRAITYQLKSSFESEVGLVGANLTTGGQVGYRRRSISMKQLVLKQEFGYQIKVTPKMLAAIIATLNTRRTKKGNLKRSAKQALNAIYGKTRKRKGDKPVSRINRRFRVPPRPLFTKTFTDPKLKRKIDQIFIEAIEDAFKELGAENGEHKYR